VFHFYSISKKLFGGLFLLLILLQCSEVGTATSDPIEALSMVPKTALSDRQEIERGIDAVPGTPSNNIIEIMWFASPDERIDRFRLYRSEDPQGQVNFVPIATIDVPNRFNQDTVFQDPFLETDRPYYYYVTALTEGGTESEPSDTVWYSLIDKAEPSTPSGTIRPGQPRIEFTFRVPTSATPNGYILRIEREIGSTIRELILLDVVDPFTGNFGEPQITHVLEGDSLFNIFEDDVQYRWRIDLLPGDKVHSGSESNWQFFTIDWGI